MKLTPTQITASRQGLNALVGSPYRIKQIQDGKEGLKCPHCRQTTTPIISPNGQINCGSCEATLYKPRISSEETVK